MKKILLDTDIGSDIDDAVCLAYLLAHPECDLLGITTVSGETHKRAMLASALCYVADKPETPIMPGAENPLIIAQEQTKAQQAAALGSWEHEATFMEGEAIEFLRDTIRLHPGEVTLLAIGPLTNIALLFKIDEEIPHLLKEIVLMCGWFTEDKLEWNAKLDPHATAIVYNAPVKIHRSIGIDVTRQVRMDASQVSARFTHPVLQPVKDFARVWFEERDVLTFHDPLAAATIFNDTVCQFSPGVVDVEYRRGEMMGQTKWTPRDTGQHQVALQVDAAGFFDEYFSVFKQVEG